MFKLKNIFANKNFGKKKMISILIIAIVLILFIMQFLFLWNKNRTQNTFSDNYKKSQIDKNQNIDLTKQSSFPKKTALFDEDPEKIIALTDDYIIKMQIIDSQLYVFSRNTINSGSNSEEYDEEKKYNYMVSIYDISSPKKPSLISRNIIREDSSRYYNEMLINGKWAYFLYYVYDETKEANVNFVDIFSISENKKIQSEKRFQLSHLGGEYLMQELYGLRVDGNDVFIPNMIQNQNDWSYKFQLSMLHDNDDGKSPMPSGSIVLETKNLYDYYNHDIEKRGNLIFVLEDASKIQVFDSGTQLLEQSIPVSNANDLFLSGNILYILADKGNDQVIYSYEINDKSKEIYLRNNINFAVTSNEKYSSIRSIDDERIYLNGKYSNNQVGYINLDGSDAGEFFAFDKFSSIFDNNFIVRDGIAYGSASGITNDSDQSFIYNFEYIPKKQYLLDRKHSQIIKIKDYFISLENDCSINLYNFGEDGEKKLYNIANLNKSNQYFDENSCPRNLFLSSDSNRLIVSDFEYDDIRDIHIYDTSDVNNIFEITSINTNEPQYKTIDKMIFMDEEIDAKENLIFCLCSDSNYDRHLCTIDISNTKNPSLYMGEKFDLRRQSILKLSNNYLYVYPSSEEEIV